VAPLKTPPYGPTYKRDAQTLERFAKQIHETLFRGIVLSRAQDSVAQQVIHESVTKRELLDPTSATFFENARAIVDERNAALLAILPTPTDRSVFERNSKVQIFMVECFGREPPT